MLLQLLQTKLRKVQGIHAFVVTLRMLGDPAAWDGKMTFLLDDVSRMPVRCSIFAPIWRRSVHLAVLLVRRVW